MDTYHESRPSEFRMFDARFKKLLRITDSPDGTTHMRSQLIRIFMSAIRKISLPVSPNMFDWIEFGSITWERMNMKPLSPLQECFDIFSLMDGTTIPDHDHLPAQMTQQMPQVRDHLCASNVIGMKADIKSETSAIGRNGKTSNDRDFIAPITVTQNRRATCRRPCSTNIRDEQESAFVQKCQMGFKFFGLFLWGHVWRFHRAMAFSSLCRARRSGF